MFMNAILEKCPKREKLLFDGKTEIPVDAKQTLLI
jgi:hypothetical protein